MCGSRGAAGLPVVLESATEPSTTKSDDGIGPADSPEHARALQAGGDDGLASGFDDARADKETLGAKDGIAHPVGVALVRTGSYVEHRMSHALRSPEELLPDRHSVLRLRICCSAGSLTGGTHTFLYGRLVRH